MQSIPPSDLKTFFATLAKECSAHAPEPVAQGKAPAAPKYVAKGNKHVRMAPRAQSAMTYWSEVATPRFPYIPSAVQAQVAQWIRELDAADELEAAGEVVLPLLLEGETRCGKTSLASVIGRARGVPAYRMNLAAAVGSYMGETAKALSGALQEATSRAGLWLVDEIDAVASKRRGNQGAEQERAHAVGTLLTKLEQLPAGLPLIATTNLLTNIDPAVLGRFTCIKWPPWEQLPLEERRGFLDAQGGHAIPETEPQSYADAVKLARAERVESILSGKGKQLGLGGVQ